MLRVAAASDSFVCTAPFSRLVLSRTTEVGELGVASFGRQTSVIHALGEPFSDQSGARCMSRFTFKQDQTNWIEFLRTLVSTLDAARANRASGAGAGVVNMQLAFIISDGRLQVISLYIYIYKLMVVVQ